MFYELLGINNKGTANKEYVYRDTSGKVYNLTSKQIKADWAGNIFQGVKLDSAGRLVENTNQMIGGSTPNIVMHTPVSSNTQGYRVYTGNSLTALVTGVTKGKNRRYAVEQVIDRLKNYEAGKVCVVKGLRRTGKTTAILQAVQVLLTNGVSDTSIGFITATTEASALEVVGLIEASHWEYVFVDEVTHLNGLLDILKDISDNIAMFKKVVLTGTDSYVWPMAACDVLYGRTLPVDLTYMSLKEYCEVFPERVKGYTKFELIAYFCRFGGVLSVSEYAGLKNAYVSIQTAIVGNIVDTILRNKNHNTIKTHAGALYSATREQLTEAVIIAILEACKTQGSDKLKTQGVRIPEIAAGILEKESPFKSNGVKNDVVVRLLGALIELNVLDKLENFAKKSDAVEPSSKMELVCHISSLYNTIIGAIDDAGILTGEAFENLILSQCVQFIRILNQQYISEYKVKDVVVGYCRYEISEEKLIEYGEKNKTPEADLIIRQRDSAGITSSCFIEVKRSTSSDTGHAKNMFLQSMREAVGAMDRYLVVYMGETKKIREVDYVNAVDFLMDIGKWVLI